MNEEKLLSEKPNTSQPSEKKTLRALIVYALIAVFILLTAGMGVLSLAVRDKAFSENENRVLAQMPSFSVEKLLDGSFMSEFEDWLSDQFPLRDMAISLKTDFDLLSGKREENGVYIGKNGRLFDFQTEFDKDGTAEKIAAIDRFLQKYPDAEQLIALIPNSSYIYSEDLPYSVNLSSQKEEIRIIYDCFYADALVKLDACSILSRLKNENTELYYKTDHHWTTPAAFSVYSAIADKWQLDSSVQYTFHTVSRDFEGTLASSAGVHSTKDCVEICVPENSEETYTVNFQSEQIKTATLFSEEKLSSKNKYEVFLGGNYDKVIIETTAQNDKSLLIVKDSYANCMIPMLTPHFSEIVIVDPRYMTESIDTVMSEHSFTHILFLYNLNTFLEDSSVCDVFESDSQ